jgi:hypothetical protein
MIFYIISGLLIFESLFLIYLVYRDAMNIYKKEKEIVIHREYEARLREEIWAGLGMIRDALETLGPVGVLKAAEHINPGKDGHIISESEELVNGIQKILL